MAFVTVQRLIALAPRIAAPTAESLARVLEVEMPKFGVATLLRRAHFLGQVCHESGGFTRFEENLRYRADRIGVIWPRLLTRANALAGNPEALANAAYAGKIGNGDENSGDGWRYRGRGLIQLTGRSNYAMASNGLGIDLVGNPDQVAQPRGAVLTALWFWQSRGCNEAADQDDAEAVTRIINGKAMVGLAERIQLIEKAKAIFK